MSSDIGYCDWQKLWYNILLSQLRTNVFYFYRELLMRYARWDIPDKGPEIPPELLRAGCTPLLAALLAL